MTSSGGLTFLPVRLSRSAARVLPLGSSFPVWAALGPGQRHTEVMLVLECSEGECAQGVCAAGSSKEQTHGRGDLKPWARLVPEGPGGGGHTGEGTAQQEPGLGRGAWPLPSKPGKGCTGYPSSTLGSCQPPRAPRGLEEIMVLSSPACERTSRVSVLSIL